MKLFIGPNAPPFHEQVNRSAEDTYLSHLDHLSFCADLLEASGCISRDELTKARTKILDLVENHVEGLPPGTGRAH